MTFQRYWAVLRLRMPVGQKRFGQGQKVVRTSIVGRVEFKRCCNHINSADYLPNHSSGRLSGDTLILAACMVKGMVTWLHRAAPQLYADVLYDALPLWLVVMYNRGAVFS